MVDAVITGLNAPLARSGSDQLAAVRAVEANAAVSAPEPVEQPVAPFVSPYISVDVNFDQAVIQIRDSDTGDVVNQFPSEETLAARARTEAIQNINTQSLQSSQETAAPQSTTFVASDVTVAQAAPETSSPAAAQAAIAALSAGAQSGTTTTTTVNTSA